MRFTDLFIRKPVLATVVSLFILLLGMRAIFDLNVRQFPEIQNAVVTITTVYVGADAELIQGFITTPLEREVAAAAGIDYLVSTSIPGASVIQAFLRLEEDPNATLTQIVSQVNRVRGELPLEAEDPVVSLSVGESIAAMYLSFFSDRLATNQITDYLVRVVEPELSTLPGVQRAEILGGETFAARIWLDVERMAALGVTGRDVQAALRANNVLSAVGSTRGELSAIELSAQTNLRHIDEFASLIVREETGSLIRLEDIAEIELGADNYATSVRFNGQNATFIGIELAPDANALEVIAEVRDVFRQRVVAQLPEGLQAEIVYDSTDYIESAIREVLQTLFIALAIVLLVIYLFLGSLRSVIIPAVAIPLAIIGTFLLMLLMGFTINLLTLLAMVLAIGIVVDDAIIMVENIHRHIEEGMEPLEAALQGAQELAWPIVAMSTTLIAVFLPIGFVGGLTGTLFIEFAFTLAGAVLLSGIIALTLSPMMASKLLKGHREGRAAGRLEGWLDARFLGLQNRYRRRLHGALNERFTLLVFGLIVLVSCYFLFITSATELEPPEDLGFVFSIMTGDAYLSLQQLERNTALIDDLDDVIPELRNTFVVNGFGGSPVPTSNEAIAGFVFAPWDQRERKTASLLQDDLQPRLDSIPGLQIFAVEPPSLPSPGGGGTPISLIIGTTGPIENLGEFADEIIGRAMATGRFIFLASDLDFDQPRMEIRIDREKAAQMGVDMATLTADLVPLLSGSLTGRFTMDGRSYPVIPQVQRSARLNPEQLENLYTRTQDGELVALSNLITLEETVVPRRLQRFQQLNAVTLQGVPRPGVTLGEALEVLEQIANETLPAGYSIDYSGQSRQLKTEGAQFVITFFFSLIIIYLVLSAQFESFRDPLIMLMTVPMSIAGALLFISLGFTSLNIYTQVGLVTLIGLITKHGILIVEFANQLQHQGHSKRKAIEEAASLRLRPILMTTSATVIAMVPLLIATGAGAGSRFAMGLVIASGMTIGTLFTLFIVPAVYLYLAKDRSATIQAA